MSARDAPPPDGRDGGWKPYDTDTFHPEVVELEARALPRIVPATVLVLAALVAAAILWAVFARTDRVVVADAALVSTRTKQLVQPFGQSIIREMRLRPGALVEAGDVLVTFDTDLSRAELLGLRRAIASLELELARLKAEAALDGSAAPPPTLLADTSAEASLQLAILQGRADELAARARSDTTRTETLDKSIAAATGRLKLLTSQAARFTAELAGLEKLKAGGNSTTDRLSTLEDKIVANRIETAKLESEIDQARDSARLIAIDATAFRTGRLVEARKAIATNERDLVQKRAQLERLDYLAERDTIVAKFDGVVLQVADKAPGTAVVPNDVLMTIAPLLDDGEIEIEALIGPQNIGWVAQGQPVRFKLDSLPASRHGVIAGTVRAVSADRSPAESKATDQTGATAAARPGGHRAFVAVSTVDLRNLPANFRLLPGMSGKAEIKIGTRSVIQYLFQPFLEAKDRALTDPN